MFGWLVEYCHHAQTDEGMRLLFQGTDGVDLSLSLRSRRFLDIFAVVNGISKLSQTIM